MSEITQKMDSRRVFTETLIELAEKDKDIVWVVCDVGFNYVDEFRKRFPDRFFNFGVTEPTSTIISAGLALKGKKVWFYSMINFVTTRVHEQIRNAIVKHGADVKLLGVKGSDHYRMLGFSHNLLWDNEEVEWLSKLMPCHLPKSNEEVKQAVLSAYESGKPAYIRL